MSGESHLAQSNIARMRASLDDPVGYFLGEANLRIWSSK